MQSGPYVFQDDHEKLTLGSDGQVQALDAIYRSASLIKQPGPFSSVLVGTQRYPVTKLDKTSAGYVAQYGDSGVKATMSIESTPAGICFRVLDVSGPADQLTFVSIPYSVEFGHVRGGHMAMRRGPADAVAILPLSPNVNPGDVKGAAEDNVSVYRDLGWQGGAIMVASPPAGFLPALHAAEVAQKVPFATVDGQWCKTAAATNDSYLFTDAGLRDIPDAIRFAKEGGLGAIMLMQSTWSTSGGSYPINRAKYPGGMHDLEEAASEVHAAGLKFGLHATCPMITFNDPMIQAGLHDGVYHDGTGNLGSGVSDSDRSVEVENFQTGGMGGPLKAGDLLAVDSELLYVTGVAGSTAQVSRSSRGTRHEAHRAGAPVYRIPVRYGAAVVDLKSQMYKEVVNNVAEAIKSTRADMFYFDGSEAVDVEGPLWYEGGKLPFDVWSAVGPNLLVMGSTWTPWSWHIFARATADDFASMAPDEFLDKDKIPHVWYHLAHGVPVEMGWTAILSTMAEHSATTRADIEHLGVRMIAYNCPVGIEARMDWLRDNKQTDELLQTLKTYDDARKAGVTPATAEALKTGSWRLRQGQFVSTSKFGAAGAAGESVQVNNPDGPQVPAFVLTVTPVQTEGGGVPILSSALSIQPAGSNPPPVETQRFSPSTDLSATTGLRVQASGGGPSVMVIQLFDSAGSIRDYVVHLSSSGQTTQTAAPGSALDEPGIAVPDSYLIKRSNSGFDYKHVAGFYVRFLSRPSSAVTIQSVEAVALSSSAVGIPAIHFGSGQWSPGVTVAIGQRVEWDGFSDHAELVGPNEEILQKLPPPGQDCALPTGASSVSVSGITGNWKLTLRVKGRQVGP